MKYNIFEDLKNVEDLINILNKKVLELRKRNLLDNNSDLFRDIEMLYKEVIDPWMEEYYLFSKELETKEEQDIINTLLDTINVINKIINGN